MKKIALSLLTFLCSMTYAVDFSQLDSAYLSGNIGYIRENINSIAVMTQEDKERLEYFQAIVNSSPKFIKELKSISEQQGNKYSQASQLELAKVYYLEQNYQKAKEFLGNVTDQSLHSEKYYWMAYCDYSSGEYLNSIYWAQKFLSSTTDNDKIENIYILISNCYLKEKQYKLALELLKTVQNLNLFSAQKAAALYNIGLCYELLGDKDKQNESFFTLKRDFPYSKYAQMLENQPEHAGLTPNTSEKPAPPSGTFYLQVGAFKENENALELASFLKEKNFASTIKKHLENNTLLYKVLVGPLVSQDEVKQNKSRLLSYNYPSFTVKSEEKKESTLSQKSYYLQCGVFKDASKLRKRIELLASLGIEAKAYRRTINKEIYNYGVIGPFPNKEKALIQQQELKKHDIETNLFVK